MMTKEDWGRVEKALSGTYGFAKLRVDGREVTLQRELVSKNALGIVTYVDGHWKGTWFSSREEHPEQQYLRPYSRFIHSAKNRERMKKLSKRLRRKLGWEPDQKMQFFSPIWNNAESIRRHYQKTFESIELVETVG